MICPNCKNKISFWKQLNFNEKNNITNGFHCSYCNSFLVTKKFKKVKSVAYLIAFLFILFFSVIRIVSNKYINQNSYWNVLIISGTGISSLLLFPYIFLNYFIELEIKDSKKEKIN